jgi:hypothetical protein
MTEIHKMKIPTAIMFVVGMWMILEYYLPFPGGLIIAGDELRNFISLIAAGSVGVGTVYTFMYHAKRIIKKTEIPHWNYSILLIASFLITTAFGIYGGREQLQFDWIFANISSPLGSAVLSTTAFFITSAAFRVFRIKNLDAGILLICGVIVVLSLVPLATSVFPPFTPIAEWIQNVPGGAGFRGFIMGSALGVVGISLRVLLGMQKEVLR